MPPKRKRGGADQGGSRSAPYRPEQTSLGQHDRGYSDIASRGGRGGRSTRRGDRRDSGQASTFSPTQSTHPAPSAPRPSNPSSQLATQSTTAAPAVPAAPATVVPPSPRSSNYVYLVVTDQRIRSWAQSGRQEVLDHAIQSRDDEDSTEVSIIYQELLRSVLDLRIDAQDAGTLVKDITGDVATDASADKGTVDLRIAFLDTVSIFLEMEEDPDREQLQKFMLATNIPSPLMRQVLDNELLVILGLLKDTFHRMSIRHTTNLLYRQQSYNLLREESEGFAKLMTELYANSHAASSDLSFDAAQTTFERVKGLIGTFDLDVGRVLDITLDVFAATIVKQVRSIVRFLRTSSWWPRSRSHGSNKPYLGGLPRWAHPELLGDVRADDVEDEEALAEQRRQRDAEFWDTARRIHMDAFFQLGGREVAEDETLRAAEAELESSSHDDADRQWIVTTKTLPPPGNRVAAQILGFKLRLYSAPFRGREDVLPANLLYLAALLIKIGFISLNDLYPHLWPADEGMATLRQKRKAELGEKEKKSRTGGAANALMMAGALPDDMPSLSGASRRDAAMAKTDASQSKTSLGASQKAPEVPEPLEQKVQLLEQLLGVGAIPESLYILGQFPWIPEMYPTTIIPRIHRIILHSISKLAKESQPTPTLSDCISRKIADTDQSGVSKGSVKQSEPPRPRSLRWPWPDRADHGDGIVYRFYFEEWADNIPVCQNVDDLFTLCGTFMNVSGVNIGKEPELLLALTRIGAQSLGQDPSKHNRDRWQDLLKRLLVPALSLVETNPSCVDAVWALLKRYPIAVRFNIYAEWYEGSTSRSEAMTTAFNRTRHETLSIMKRLSLKNLSEMARSLAKTAYSSPGVVFKVALDQIEAYSNLIQAFVECAKYFTDLGFDVLVWSLMSSLGGKQRSRTQETSVLLTSKWLQALSKFSGHVFKRYAIMDASPVLQYVNDQLYKGSSTDLVILKELIVSMGGLVPDVDFTDAQIHAMAGGEALRRQTLINLGDKRFESGKSSKKLMQALVDSKLAGRLLVNLAQYRQSAIYKLPEDEANTKYMSTILDDAHQVLTQYLDLLRSNLDPSQFDALVPSVDRLMQEFGLEASLAFLIGRAGLASLLSSPRSPASAPIKQDAQVSQVPLDTDGDVSMVDGKMAAPPPKSGQSTTNGDKMDIDTNVASTTGVVLVNGRKNDQMLDVLQPLIVSARTTVPPEVLQHISPEYFVLFWSLQLGNMTVPQDQYTAEHDRLKKEAEDVMRDRSDMTRAGMNKKNEKKEALLDVAKTIRDEMLSHAEKNQKTRILLLKHAGMWFPATKTEDATYDALLEQCLLPRMLLSPVDTEYSFRMIKFLHENRVVNFKLKGLYDRFFNPNRLRDLIFTCTVREAEHLGRFLKCVLAELSRWHASTMAYEKEALGVREGRRNYIGFANTIDASGKPETVIEHPQFRDLLYGWHKNLNVALKDCLENTEWMHIRNAITVLKCVLEVFPAVDFMGRQFSDQLKKITDREAASKTASESTTAHRVDLSVAAQTALSELQKRKPKWVMVQAFRPNAVRTPAPSAPPTTTDNSQAGKLQDEPKPTEPSAAALRPSAPEFRPQRPAQ